MTGKTTYYVAQRRHEIAHCIKNARVECNLTQKDVAGYLGCSRRRMNRVEQGDIELMVGEIELLTLLFHKPLSHFFQEPGPMVLVG